MVKKNLVFEVNGNRREIQILDKANNLKESTTRRSYSYGNKEDKSQIGSKYTWKHK